MESAALYCIRSRDKHEQPPPPLWPVESSIFSTHVRKINNNGRATTRLRLPPRPPPGVSPPGAKPVTHVPPAACPIVHRSQFRIYPLPDMICSSCAQVAIPSRNGSVRPQKESVTDSYTSTRLRAPSFATSRYRTCNGQLLFP